MKSYPTLLAGALSLVVSAIGAFAGDKPNIIFIMTDDQGYGDLSCHGHPFIKTPNLDKLHAESTRFTNYHASPTCAPTRAGLMSGRNPFEVGVTHTILERERMALGVPTVAEVLRKAGYTTGIFGKWHLGEEDQYQPGSRGFDEVFIHGAGGIGQNFAGSQGDVPGNGYFDPTIRHNGKFVKTKGFCTDVFFQEALRWMKNQKDKPFFAYIPTNAPHGPFIAPDEYKEMYAKHASGDANQAFFGMISNIDDNVGLLMKKLDEWDLADNTLLIFTTDNGSAKGSKIFNAGMKGGKGSVNEGGSRVPLFFRLPGKTTPGKDLGQLARHIDMFPTLADIAGADISDLGLEGRSLAKLLADDSMDWPDRTLFFHGGRWPKTGAPGNFGKGNPDPENYKYRKFAVRTERWRLVGKDALYDLKADPGESNNVIDEHPEVAAKLLKSYEGFWSHARPLMVNEDAPLDVEKPFKANYLKQKETEGIPTWDPPSL
ncbi:arylsulfatase [Haloferula rosea]|uniref:Arylsulfatase n=1 Tax=Haloferula rosea TaxID=490093 RepID=A0A934R584_9BACT|nr:arylsulfatase [Haloferula rosea]MBK1825539.1 arylsulfatase [Haloferula rosea]